MASPFLYPPPDIKQPVIIRNDSGGEVVEYGWALSKYNQQQRRVEIRGSCRSACLLALGVKNVCVAPGAVVKAHHAYEKSTGYIREDVTNLMLSYLPSKIRAHLNGKIQKNYTPESTLSYEQLVKLGVPSCDNYKTVTASDRPPAPEPKKVTYTWGGGLFPLIRWVLK